jgi:hypothetical protein
LTWPEFNEAVVIDKGTTAAVIAIENDFEAFCGVALESCTCTVMTLEPACVGLPEIVALLRLRPTGSVPEVIDQE